MAYLALEHQPSEKNQKEKKEKWLTNGANRPHTSRRFIAHIRLVDTSQRIGLLPIGVHGAVIKKDWLVGVHDVVDICRSV